MVLAVRISVLLQRLCRSLCTGHKPEWSWACAAEGKKPACHPLHPRAPFGPHSQPFLSPLSPFPPLSCQNWGQPRFEPCVRLFPSVPKGESLPCLSVSLELSTHEAGAQRGSPALLSPVFRHCRSPCRCQCGPFVLRAGAVQV